MTGASCACRHRGERTPAVAVRPAPATAGALRQWRHGAPDEPPLLAASNGAQLPGGLECGLLLPYPIAAF